MTGQGIFRRHLLSHSTANLVGMHEVAECSHKQKRKVQFLPSVRCRVVATRADLLTKQCFDRIWYSVEDIESMRNQLRATLLVLRKAPQVIADADPNEFCMRGLEGRTEEGHLRTKVQRKQSIHAVLRMQELTTKTGSYNSELVARAYAEYTRESNRLAHKKALEDEDFVRKEIARKENMDAFKSTRILA